MKPLDPRLLPHLRPARAALLASVSASAVGGLLLVAQAVVVGSLVAALVLSPGSSRWTAWVPWLIAIFVLRALASYAVDVAAARASGQVTRALRQRLLANALTRPHLVRDSKLGETSTLATRGMAAIDPYLTRYVPALALAAVLPAVTVLAIGWLDWLSGLIVLGTLPLVPVFAILVGMTTRERADRQWRQLAGLSGHFLDVMRGLPTLVAHRRAKAQSSSIRAITDRYRRATVDTLKLAFASSAVLELIATLSVALVAVCVGLRLAGGGIDLRTALIVLLLAPEAYWPIRRVGAEFHAAAEGTATFEQATELLASSDLAAAPPLALLQPPSLTLTDITVRHPGAASPTLNGLSLSIPAGSLTAIAGPSGCGKSTLLAALLGELPTEDGRIDIDATPLSSVDLDSWRSSVAHNAQRPWLTAGSIAGNLRIGSPEANDAQLWAALARVDLEDVVASLPDGLDTELGEDGAGLSAGQHARLALARVVLATHHGRQFVVLDEPTAHLDPDTEEILIDTMRWLAGRATVIVVAHSPAVIAAADHVITLAAPEPAEASRSFTPEPTEASRPFTPAPTPPARDEAAQPRWGLRSGMVLGTLASASGVALTATAGWLIAKAAEHPPVLLLMVAIVGVRLFGLARPVLRYAERLVSHDAALRLLADRRAEMYDALVPLVPGRLGTRRGELLAALVDDIDAELDHHLRVRLPVVTAIGVTGIAAATALVIQSIPAALITLAFALLAGGPAWLVANRGARRSEPAFVEARGELWSRVATTLHDARQLVLWQVAAPALGAVDHADAEAVAAAHKSGRAQAMGRAWVLLISGAGVAAMAAMVAGSSISPAMQALLVLVPLALGEVLTPLADAAALKVRTDRAAQRLSEIASQTPAVTDPAKPDEAPDGVGISTHSLSAGWGATPAFTDLDLAVCAGQRVAIVGPSGCGKSTLAAALMRFIDPLRGTVSLDGADTRRLLLDDVRERVGLVDDDPYIFSTSLVENVRLARPDASDAEVAEALGRAHLGDWIAGLPDGLHTMIGDGHAGVSGGERARIAMARTLLADQRIVVLDEPTAHLDSATAQALADEVLSGDRAVLWITHGTVGLDSVDEVLRLTPPRQRARSSVDDGAAC